jgi:hypothetical protein
VWSVVAGAGAGLRMAGAALALVLDALGGGEAAAADNAGASACALELALERLGAAVVAGAAGAPPLMAGGEGLFEDLGGIVEKRGGRGNKRRIQLTAVRRHSIEAEERGQEAR